MPSAKNVIGKFRKVIFLRNSIHLVFPLKTEIKAFYLSYNFEVVVKEPVTNGRQNKSMISHSF